MRLPHCTVSLGWVHVFRTVRWTEALCSTPGVVSGLQPALQCFSCIQHDMCCSSSSNAHVNLRMWRSVREDGECRSVCLKNFMHLHLQLDVVAAEAA